MNKKAQINCKISKPTLKRDIDQKTNFLLLMFSLKLGIPQIDKNLLGDKDYHHLFNKLKKYKRTKDDDRRFVENTLKLAAEIINLKEKLKESIDSHGKNSDE